MLSIGGRGDSKGEGTVTDERGETIRSNKFGGIKSGGGLLLLFVIIGGMCNRKENIIVFIFGV